MSGNSGRNESTTSRSSRVPLCGNRNPYVATTGLDPRASALRASSWVTLGGGPDPCGRTVTFVEIPKAASVHLSFLLVDDNPVELCQGRTNRAETDQLSLYLGVTRLVERHYDAAPIDLFLEEGCQMAHLEESEVELDVEHFGVREVKSAR